jgi:putative phosphoesterase
MRIGLVSDTHGLVRPEALEFLRGSDAIVHAGDIGNAGVLRALEALAPVHAIRGNNDTGPWARELPDSLAVELGGVRLFVLHDFKTLARHPAPPGTQVMVCGHSHKPLVADRAEGFRLVNPGSAGPRRFKLPVTAAELLAAAGGAFELRIRDLLADPPAHP